VVFGAGIAVALHEDSGSSGSDQAVLLSEGGPDAGQAYDVAVLDAQACDAGFGLGWQDDRLLPPPVGECDGAYGRLFANADWPVGSLIPSSEVR
jgi:hypothetical protein